MDIPLPDDGGPGLSPAHLWPLLAVAAAAAVWVFLLPDLARAHPGFSWTFPLLAVAAYCGAKGWRVATGANVACAAALVALEAAGGVQTPVGPVRGAWYPAVSLGAVGLTAVGAVTAEVSRRRWRRQLESLARDPESGLVRRWLFDWYLQKAVASAKRGKTLSLVLFGFQAFDRSADWSGRDGEKDLLEELGALVRETSRSEDFLARYDRHRFAALLYGEDGDSAAAYAERIRKQIEFAEPSGDRTCLASAGVAEFEGDDFETAGEFAEAAERALASAAYAGGNRVIVFGSQSFRQARSDGPGAGGTTLEAS